MSKQNYWQRMRSGRMSRRGLLRASARAGVGAAGLALVGCGDDDDDQAVAQGESEQQAEEQAQAAEQQAAPQADQQEQAAAQAQAQVAAEGSRYGGFVDVTGDDGGLFDPAVSIHGGTDASIFQVYDFINYLDEGNVLTDAMADLPEVIDELNFVYSIKPRRVLAGQAAAERAAVHGRGRGVRLHPLRSGQSRVRL